MSEHTKSWLSGFIDGEGCFVIYVSGDRKVAQCRFVIQVREDDVDALLLAQETLDGAGTIRTHHSPSARASKPLSRLLISSKSDCARLIAHLDKYPLLAKKRRDYVVWRQAVESLAVGRDVPALLALRDELRATRRYV